MKLRDKIGTILVAGSIAYASSMASGQSPEDYGARTMQDKVCYSVRDDLVSIRGGDDDLRNNVHVRSAYGNPDFPSEPRIEKNNCRIVKGSAELCVPASIYLGNSPERRFRGESYEGFEPNVFPSQLEFENGINPNNIYEDDELCYRVTCDNKTFPFPEGFDELKVSDINGQRYVEPRRITKICTPARRSLYEVNQRFVKRASLGEVVDEGGFPTGTVKEFYFKEGINPQDLVIFNGNRFILDGENRGVYVYDSKNNFLRRFGEDIIERESSTIRLDSENNIYVADTNNSRITKFSNQGNLIRHYEGFNEPQGLDIDSSDNLWVADTGNERIVKLDNNGNTLATFNVSVEDEEGAKSIAIDEERDRFYLTRDDTRPSIHNIYNGKIQGYLSPAEGFNEIFTSNIKVDSLGNVFLQGSGRSNSIYIFDSLGRLLKNWGGEGRESGQFRGRLSAEIDSNGNIVIVDDSGKIQTFYRGSSLEAIIK